jgi:hypothetical protein
MFAPHRVSVLLLLLCASCLVVAGSLTAQQTSSPVTDLIGRADAGEDSARQELYRFLLRGEPGSGTFDAALVWVRERAAQDVPAAELVLGYLYQQGRGVARDYASAENYLAAALHDNHSAQNNLAFLYSTVSGCRRTSVGRSNCISRRHSRTIRTRNAIWVRCITRVRV